MDKAQRVVRVISDASWEATVKVGTHASIQKLLNQWRHEYHLRDIVVTPVDEAKSHLHLWRRQK
jgi:hypothetical protein